jgi:flavin reductase (DIM6/NTAB) family NADH-FMN oxidoreductase RutF
MQKYSAERDTARRALGALAAGVTVITTRDEERRPIGMTATAFTGVSHEPPSLLVCLNKQNRTRDHLQRNSRFGVNLLASDAVHQSDYFAAPGGSKEVPPEWIETELEWSSPNLCGAISFFDCIVDQVIETGTHVVVLGAVESIGLTPLRELAAPLVHYRGQYWHLFPAQRRTPSLAIPVVLEAVSV